MRGEHALQAVRGAAGIARNKALLFSGNLKSFRVFVVVVERLR